MQEKIEWYREVLELEPGSKVFFPLARLLGQSRAHDEAVRVLRHGLEKHPEYIEARLLLVQLLQEAGDAAACQAELEGIHAVFSAYPGFWEAWSEHAASEDIACALRYLAAAFASPGLSLRDVILAGLNAMGMAEPRPRLQAPVAPPEVAKLTASLQQPAEPTEAPHVTEPAENEEPTLRTRSMADILAEQGDLAGALEIYQEILDRTPPGEEAEALRERIEQLSTRAGSMPPSPPKSDSEDPSEQNKMRNMLENLAQRLDARAQA